MNFPEAKLAPSMNADLLRELWDQTPDAVITVGVDGMVLHSNRAAAAMFGYEEREAMGRPLAELIVPPEEFEDEQRKREEAARTGLAVYESVRRRQDGALVHVSVSVKAIRDAAEEVTCFLLTKKDVTRLKVLRDA